MTRVRSAALGRWKLLLSFFSASVCGPALLSCSVEADSPETQSGAAQETPSEPKGPTEIAGGQSGNEGEGEATPCLIQGALWISGVVTDIGGGCATVSDVEGLFDVGLESLADSTSVRGVYRPFFAGEPIEVGQTVYALFSPGPMGPPDGSLQLAIVEEGIVHLMWRGIAYESSLEELTSEGCKDLFLRRPFSEEEPPEEEIPVPLSCAEQP